LGESCGNISGLKDEIVRELSPISPIVFTVLETANSVVPECIDVFRNTCSYKDKIPTRIYKNLYPSLMRAIVQVLLHHQNIQTQALFDTDGKIEDMLDWECNVLSNNGLAGKYCGYNYRILKALNGKLPPPGNSSRKREFYRQAHLAQSKFCLFPDEQSNIQKSNVIYLWDNIGGNKINLTLVCPKWGNTSKAKDYFAESIEHPVLSIKPEPEDIVKEIKLDYLTPELKLKSENEEPNDIWQ